MDFLSAIKISKWVRRSSWPCWINIEGWLKYKAKSISYHDLVSQDWEAHRYRDDDREPDDAMIRFGLMEIE